MRNALGAYPPGAIKTSSGANSRRLIRSLVIVR